MRAYSSISVSLAKDQRDLRDQLGHKGQRATPGHRVCKDLLDLPVRKDLKAILELLVLKERKDPQVRRDRLDRKVHKVYLEPFLPEATFSSSREARFRPAIHSSAASQKW